MKVKYSMFPPHSLCLEMCRDVVLCKRVFSVDFPEISWPRQCVRREGQVRPRPELEGVCMDSMMQWGRVCVCALLPIQDEQDHHRSMINDQTRCST